MTLPDFQPQNPAYSGYSLGWASCTTYSAAMAASFDRQVGKLCTGAQVRQKTGDTVGGTTLAQIDDALRSGWGVDLDTRYRLPWSEFEARIDRGEGAVLQGHSSVFVGTPFNEGSAVNHAIFVPPGWQVMDPAADGRRAGIYNRRTRADVYPKSLVREFAGHLVLDESRHLVLGNGLVYASFTRDRVNVVSYKAVVHPAPPAKSLAYHVYTVTNGVITARVTRYTKGFTAVFVSAPRLYRWPSHPGGPVSVSLIRVNGGSLNGKYLNAKFVRTA